jgi:hypothetical protein
MNPLSRKSTEEIIIDAFEAKVAKAAAEKIDAVLDGAYKVIYDQVCELFGEDANIFTVERCVDEICNSVNLKIQRQMRNEF